MRLSAGIFVLAALCHAHARPVVPRLYLCPRLDATADLDSRVVAVDSVNSGWSVDGNNYGWSVDGNNYGWSINGGGIPVGGCYGAPPKRSAS
ncbi:unnamed protein product [Mycena citricolor]|uniref:Uncharacterized protein n=1 Tax=Mycena citricolor TaxID=2018698 RepID=A0AAD2K5X1_9AGAR|nr:unnamed protein product [Mycena citricolor]CAK5281034.1 unnamed protein product [Mycena citricolor]